MLPTPPEKPQIFIMCFYVKSPDLNICKEFIFKILCNPIVQVYELEKTWELPACALRQDGVRAGGVICSGPLASVPPGMIKAEEQIFF